MSLLRELKISSFLAILESHIVQHFSQLSYFQNAKLLVPVEEGIPAEAKLGEFEEGRDNPLSKFPALKVCREAENRFY